MFRLVTFKVDVRDVRTEIDTLAQFEQLECVEAYHLGLPIYSVDSACPHTQWMKPKTVPLQ